jgi:hypothetical protein
MTTAATSFANLASEFAEEIGGLERRFLRTLLPLLVRPGFLTREYREGRGSRYISPVRAYLLVSALYFAVFLGAGDAASSSVAFLSSFFDVPAAGIMFVAVPVFAIALFVGYYTPGRSYAEYLVFALYFQTALFLFALPTSLLPSASLRAWARLAYGIFYLAVGSIRLWDEPRLMAWFRAGFALLIYGMVLFVAGGILLFLVGRFGG